MFQLDRRGLTLTAGKEDIERLRAHYERNHYVILPKLIEESLLETVIEKIDHAQFVFHDTYGVLSEFRMLDAGPAATFTFLASNPAFLRAVEQITGCRQLGQFTGRVYRIMSSEDHYSEWHNDVIGDRKVAMSLNLTRGTFGGGALQMKFADSNDLLSEVRNTRFGDALLFRVSKELLHRVQGVEGGVARTAFAGWFLEGEDWLAPSGKRPELDRQSRS